MQNQELRIEIFGRVQGVGFRHFVKTNADKIGIKGFVRNMNDGNVLVVAQGEKEELEMFLSFVQRGPALSKINGISYFWKEKENKYDDFFISLDKGMFEDQKSSFINLGKRLFGVKSKVPLHIAIIPDGNRRWALEKGLGKTAGHKKATSFDNLISLLEEAKALGTMYVTLWAFSTENWKRSKKEVDYLFALIKELFPKFKEYALENEIRFRHIGRMDRIPEKILAEVKKAEEETKNFDKFNVQICLDYGGRDEIVRAVNKLLKLGVSEVKEDDISNYLDSAGIPDPDLIIRTSGEKRISGFMPFQSAYSEFYFADVYFPDFTAEDLRKAVEEFASRRRRFGG